MGFTHLHVHTEYSLLDGAARIKGLIARVKELGMDSVAITDHGSMFGVVDFYKEAKAAGIKPIIGCEVYTAARTRFDKDPEKDRHQGHLLLLAENDQGYKNLIKIVSQAYTEGFYYKPRIDNELLRQHQGGIIATSACLAGKVQQYLLRDDYEGARDCALEYQEIFGAGNFFLEIQDQGLPEEKQINPMLVKLSKETGIGLVATNDVHYINQADSEAHDILLCIQTGTRIDDPDRMRFPNDQFYLKSEQEMRRIFADLPEALSNTVAIAERCNMDFDFDHQHLPEYIPPEGYDSASYLRMLCEKGCQDRYGEITPELRERMEYELATIESMGYVDYFLIVWDFINYAKSNDITVGPGRGSAAGSIVAYSLRITDIDPIRYNLIFERFLNPERVSMPDIDVDFCDDRRGEVIDYVVNKYGADRVSQIVTFGTMKAKAAVRDVGRVLNMEPAECDRISKMIPFDLKMTLEKALVLNPELNELYRTDQKIKYLIDMAQALEGMPRHASTHAAGVVISKEPMADCVPLYATDKGVSAQFNMTIIEELGLLKMDFLGLRNLTVIKDACEAIYKNHGVRVNFADMTFDDPAVFKLISEGDTLGVFQLESGGMTGFMKKLRPDSIEDIVAGISLYRPGPMDSIPQYIDCKQHPEHVKYKDPHLEPILSVTYGCLVYQEQVMQIVRDLAGYSYGRSDLVRRAMSKKKAEVMAEEEHYFIYGKPGDEKNEAVPGCVSKGIPEQVASDIFQDMVKFASYAFNKSHAAAYAIVAYETAWLKCYYRAEFMAALMTSVSGDSSQVAKYIRDCRDHGIEVLPPDIRYSEKKFTAYKGAIRFGFAGIKNLGYGPVDEIIRSRGEKGVPKDFDSFINGVDISKINKKAVESLIKAGAFDGINPNRAQLMVVYERLLDAAHGRSKNNVAGQMSLFADFSESFGAAAEDAVVKIEMPDIRNFDMAQILTMEKDTLGVYVSGHPLDGWRERLEGLCTVDTEKFQHYAEVDEDGIPVNQELRNELVDGMSVRFGGIIQSVRTMITKKNTMMAFIQLEDLFGVSEVVVFPKTYESCHSVLKEDSIVMVTGRLQIRDEEEPKVLASTVELMEEYRCPDGENLFIRIEDSEIIDKTLARVNGILERYSDESGGVAVYLAIVAGGGKKAHPVKSGVKLSPALMEELREAFGKENCKISAMSRRRR